MFIEIHRGGILKNNKYAICRTLNAGCETKTEETKLSFFRRLPQITPNCNPKYFCETLIIFITSKIYKSDLNVKSIQPIATKFLSQAFGIKSTWDCLTEKFLLENMDQARIQ